MTIKRKNRRYIVDVHSTPLSVPVTDEVLEDFAIGAEEERRIAAPFASANLATNTLDLGASVKASDPGAAAAAALSAFRRGLRKAHVKNALASAVAVPHAPLECGWISRVAVGGHRRLGDAAPPSDHQTAAPRAIRVRTR